MPQLENDLFSTAEKIAQGKISPRMVIDECLDRISVIEDTHAFITVDADEARTVAAASTTMLEAGYRIGPLHGIPLALKDNIAVAGKRTTAGSKILADYYPEIDATVVSRLRSAGAIFIGKTNLHEFAWGATSANPHYGFVKNPWDHTKMPGGSSGGSGVAVATGTCLGALGTDTGGSICLPSSFNGITGLRPSIGRVSNAGVIPLAWSLDSVGPMAHSARDCALLLSVLAGYDPLDPGSAMLPTQDYLSAVHNPQLAGLRIGIIQNYSLDHLQSDVESAILAAMETLKGQNVSFHDISLPALDNSTTAEMIIILAEPSAYHQYNLTQRPHDYGDDVRGLLQAGALIPALHYIQAQRFRTLFRAQALQAFETVDIFIMPTSPFTAPPLGATTVSIQDDLSEDLLANIVRYTSFCPLTGFPSISIPCGFDATGLPIGMQLIAQPFAETTLLRVAAAFQEITDYHLQVPPL